MHPRLKEIVSETIEIFKKDPRIIGAWLSGSAGKSVEDVYSDVDVDLLVKDAFFKKVDRELPRLFKRLYPNVMLYWRELDMKHFRNYAVLLEIKPGMVIQYDIALLKASALSGHHMTGKTPESILFDKTGKLKAALRKVPGFTCSAKKLLWHIEQYWLFAFINTKYIRRSSLYKMLYIQDVLFHAHMEILRVVYKKHDWQWWSKNIKKLPESKQKQMLAYFTRAHVQGLIRAFKKELNVFARDARAACRICGVKYPVQFERSMLRYIRKVIS